MLTPIVNIIIPIAILLTLSGDDRLGPTPALLLAVGIPLVYGVVSLVRKRVVEASAVVGIVSVALTGLIGVLELDGRMYAIKEGGVPLTFAALILASNMTRFPIVKLLVERVLIRDRVESQLEVRGTRPGFERLVRRTGMQWAGIMALSGVLKFTLATLIVTSDAGTTAFNTDLAQLQLVEIPTTMTLTMILMLAMIVSLVRGVARLTGIPARSCFRGGERMGSLFDRLPTSRPTHFDTGSNQI